MHVPFPCLCLPYPTCHTAFSPGKTFGSRRGLRALPTAFTKVGVSKTRRNLRGVCQPLTWKYAQNAAWLRLRSYIYEMIGIGPDRTICCDQGRWKPLKKKTPLRKKTSFPLLGEFHVQDVPTGSAEKKTLTKTKQSFGNSSSSEMCFQGSCCILCWMLFLRECYGRKAWASCASVW